MRCSRERSRVSTEPEGDRGGGGGGGEAGNHEKTAFSQRSKYCTAPLKGPVILPWTRNCSLILTGVEQRSLHWSCSLPSAHRAPPPFLDHSEPAPCALSMRGGAKPIPVTRPRPRCQKAPVISFIGYSVFFFFS